MSSASPNSWRHNRDVTSSAGRELFIENLGRGRLDHGKGSGERGYVCVHRNEKAPPWMAPNPGAHLRDRRDVWLATDRNVSLCATDC
jgi:hypothetical protein